MLPKQSLKSLLLFSSTVPSVLQRERGPAGHWCWEQRLKVSCSTGAGLPGGMGRWARSAGQGSVGVVGRYLSPAIASMASRRTSVQILYLGSNCSSTCRAQLGCNLAAASTQSHQSLALPKCFPHRLLRLLAPFPRALGAPSPGSSLPACICCRKHPGPGRSHSP